MTGALGCGDDLTQLLTEGRPIYSGFVLPSSGPLGYDVVNEDAQYLALPLDRPLVHDLIPANGRPQYLVQRWKLGRSNSLLPEAL